MYRLHAGTINVDIHPLRFQVRHTPYRFRAVNWGHQIEDIELVPVSGMVHNGYQPNVTAYLYLPAMSRNRCNGRILEIWSEKIGPVSPGDRFEITIPEGCLEVG